MFFVARTSVDLLSWFSDRKGEETEQNVAVGFLSSGAATAVLEKMIVTQLDEFDSSRYPRIKNCATKIGCGCE